VATNPKGQENRKTGKPENRKSIRHLGMFVVRYHKFFTIFPIAPLHAHPTFSTPEFGRLILSACISVTAGIQCAGSKSYPGEACQPCAFPRLALVLLRPPD
jgi:hypothetical protein